MLTLSFYGPHSIIALPPGGDINNHCFVDLNNPLYNYPGIYLWGFKYDHNGAIFLDEGHSTMGRFIPYYVGKSENTIAQRIDQHLHNIIMDNSTYMRLTLAYMNEFFIDPYFPFLSFMQRDWIRAHLEANIPIFDVTYGKVAYWNKLEFYHNIDLPVPERPFNINIGLLGQDRDARDTLRNLIQFGNFYFFCGQLSDDGIPIVDGPTLTHAESYAKYSLRGKTISDAKKSVLGLKMRPPINITFTDQYYNYLILYPGIFNQGPNAYNLSYFP
jgi:hypothetical protein